MQSRDTQTGEEQPAYSIITVVEVTPERLVAQVGGPGVWIYTPELNLIETRSGSVVTYSSVPPRPVLAFPLEVGREWTSRSRDERPASENRWTGKARVEAFEPVTVPAGTFQAFRIRIESFYNHTQRAGDGYSWSGTMNETLWYAPSARTVVRWEWETRDQYHRNATVRELRSLQLAP